LRRSPLPYLWAAPASLIGLLLVLTLIGRKGRLHWHSGVLEGSGGLPGWLLLHLPQQPSGQAAGTFQHAAVPV